MTLESIQKIETQIEYFSLVISHQATDMANAILANAHRADLVRIANSVRDNTGKLRELERDLVGTRQAYLEAQNQKLKDMWK